MLTPQISKHVNSSVVDLVMITYDEISLAALSAARHEDEEIRRKEQERGKKKKKRREANEGREMIKEEEEDESKKEKVTSPRTDVIKKRALRRSTSRKRPTIQVNI